MKNIPGLKKDFEVFKKDGSVSIKDFEVLKKHQGLFGKHQGLFATFSASCIFFNVRTHRNTHTELFKKDGDVFKKHHHLF